MATGFVRAWPRPRGAGRASLAPARTALLALAAIALLSAVPSYGAVPANGVGMKRRRSQNGGTDLDDDPVARPSSDQNGRHAGDPAPLVQVTTQERTWGSRLLAAPRLQARLGLLHELGLSDSEIAQVFPDNDGSARSVRRWRVHGMARDREAARWQPVDNLCAIVGYLMSDGTFDEDATVAWLRSRSPQLDQRRPLMVLGGGKFEDVLDAAEQTLGMIVRSEDDGPGPIRMAFDASREEGAYDVRPDGHVCGRD